MADIRREEDSVAWILVEETDLVAIIQALVVVATETLTILGTQVEIMEAVEATATWIGRGIPDTLTVVQCQYESLKHNQIEIANEFYKKTVGRTKQLNPTLSIIKS